MNVFLTILSGVSVYVAGQLIMKFLIDPLHQQRETIGKVASFLIYHGNRYTSPGVPQILIDNDDQEQIRARKARLDETHEVGRNLASELVVRTHAIPCYGFLERVGLAPRRSAIATAQRGLFFITNNLFQLGGGIQNHEHAEKIKAALGIVTEFQSPDAPQPESARQGSRNSGKPNAAP